MKYTFPFGLSPQYFKMDKIVFLIFNEGEDERPP